MYTYKTSQSFIYKNYESLFLFCEHVLNDTDIHTYYRYKTLKLFFKLLLSVKSRQDSYINESGTESEIEFVTTFSGQNVNTDLDSHYIEIDDDDDDDDDDNDNDDDDDDDDDDEPLQSSIVLSEEEILELENEQISNHLNETQDFSHQFIELEKNKDIHIEDLDCLNKSVNTELLNRILNNKILIIDILNVTLDIYERYPEKKDSIISCCIYLNIVNRISYNTFLYMMDTQKINFCKFVSICLNNVKDDFDHVYETDNFDYLDYIGKFNNNSAIFCLTYNLLINDRTILLSFELRNIFFETLFFIFNKIYNHKNLIENVKNKKNAFINYLNLLNGFVLTIYRKNYDLMIHLFSLELISFNENTWDLFFEYSANLKSKKWSNYINYCFNKDDIDNLKNILKEKIVERKSFIESFPNECLDTISGTFIEEPIVIPDNKIVDKYIIYRCVLDNNENPFNRQKLTLSDIEMYNMLDTSINLIKNYKNKTNYASYIESKKK